MIRFESTAQTRTASASANGTVVAEKLIFADSIRALYRPMKASDSSLLVVAALLCFALSGYFDWQPLALWFLGVWLVQSRLFAKLLFMKPPGSNNSADRWARHYLVNGVVRALYWGCSLLYFVDPARPEIQFFITLTLGGSAAGIIAIQAFYPPLMVSYLCCLTLPFVVRMLLIGDQLHTYMGSGVLLLTVYLVYYGFFHARTLRRAIVLRHENAALVEQLREQALVLEQANQAKSQFFAAASHDLRQPLHALNFYASLLRPHPQDAPNVARIEQCVGSLNDLIAGVLDISRLDAGRVQPQIASVAVHELLRHLVSLYEGSAAAKNLKLRLNTRPLWTLSDALLLERVLSNLLSNALRYTSSGGVLLALRRRGGALQIRVYDTGIGIAPEAQGDIFAEFVQLHNPQRDPNHGVGLGLATVRRLCAVLGHGLTLHSVPGRGSYFQVVLPHIEPPPFALKTALQPEDHTLLQGRVLVVEDYQLVRESLVQTLSSWGIVCDAASDSEQAFVLAGQHTYDAVLCDLRLSGTRDGVQVLQAILLQQSAGTLLALITGEPAESLGRVPENILVLQKPLKPIRLRALLMAHLAKKNNCEEVAEKITAW